MLGTYTSKLKQCPVCKKTDPYTPSSPNCPRCGCDLTKSAAATAAAHQHTIAAAASLRSGDYQEALDHAAYAWSLSHLPAIPPLACLAALHSRQFTQLAIWRIRFSGA